MHLSLFWAPTTIVVPRARERIFFLNRHKNGHGMLSDFIWIYLPGSQLFICGPGSRLSGGGGRRVVAGVPRLGQWWVREQIMMMVTLSAILGKINSSPGRLMLMDKISWRNGWPVVGVPSDTPQPAPRVNKRRQSTTHISRRPTTSNFSPSQLLLPRSSSKYFSFSSMVP